ncbi:Apoptotic chromatin condensation inducer in the nucleus [Coemansia sp. BCRC 34301]|nr:Apoptotic chromatin condensation inducer in the nucleus [Coemansia sp. BCRC 34301]
MSALIPSELKVVDLRKELAERDLPTTGLKKDLVQRLEEALAAAGTPVQPSGGDDDDDQIDLLPADESAELEVDQPEAAMLDETADMMGADGAPEHKRKAEAPTVHEASSTHMETDDVAAEQPQLASEDSLYIKHLERPLTVYRLKEMLGKYGVVDDIWLNSIKTRGYASFETREQATAAHAAINGTRFPQDHGKIIECGFVTRTRLKGLVAEEEALSDSVRNVELTTVPVEGGNCGVALVNQKSKPKRQKTDKSSEPKAKSDRAVALAAETSASLITAAAAAAASEAKHASAQVLTRIERDALTRVTKSRPEITYRPLTDDEVAAKQASRDSAAAGA